MQIVNRDMEMARRIAEAVAQAGGRAYFVGGFVRDMLMGVQGKDVDIEIHGLTPAQTAAVLDTLGKRTEMGAFFGVYGLAHYDIDIALPRRERATGRGHKDFEVFVDPFIGLEKACERRDFTVNAIMCDVLNGEIIDLYGGRNDLQRKQLRCVCAETFAEDPLRVLRGAQFAARFGFTIDEDTQNICRKMDLTQLTYERVWGEMMKALQKAKMPSVFFEKLRDMDALDHWFTEVKALIDLPCETDRGSGVDKWVHTMHLIDAAAQLQITSAYSEGFMMSAVCFDMDPADAERFLSRITNEKRILNYCLNMVKLCREPHQNFCAGAERKRYMYMFDESICPEDLNLLAQADAAARAYGSDPCEAAAAYTAEERKLREMLAEYHDLMKKPMVMGRDLAALDLKPGPEYSKALNYARRLHLDGVEKDKALRLVCDRFFSSNK